MLSTKSLESKIIHDLSFDIYSEKMDFNAITVTQVHGNNITNCLNPNVEADGIICTCRLCTLAIKTADCLPIAIIGEKGHGLIHAGWRGLENKILFNDSLNLIQPIHFIIGAHITQSSYQVSKDFLTYFDGKFIEKKSGGLYFSLLDCAKSQIKEKFPNSIIDSFSSCTFLDIRYNSYRRNKTEKRNWNILKRINNE